MLAHTSCSKGRILTLELNSAKCFKQKVQLFHAVSLFYMLTFSWLCMFDPRAFLWLTLETHITEKKPHFVKKTKLRD